LRRLWIWIAAYPLALFLPIEALLLFWRLDLLAPWFDEADTLLFTAGPLHDAIAIPASGLHPPLYFALLWCWMRLPLGLAWTIQARTLSVIFALASTIALDRLWLRTARPATRLALLGLWTLSPFLLLYARMSRSYTMQLLLGTMALAYILRYLEERSRRNLIILTSLLVVAMYTHYVPGIALTAAANVALARRGRWRDAATIDGLVLAALFPLMAWLIPELGVWSAHRVPYALTGSILTEIPIKLAYWAVSFTLGEAIPDAVVIAGAALVPLALALAAAGLWTKRRDLAWIAIAALAIGFLGVTRWVAYPFIPARMIFCFPLFLLFLFDGAARFRRAGGVVVAALMATSLCGIWAYFHREGFRNKQYPAPMREIAARIKASGSQAVLVDSSNSDVIGLQYALGGDRPLTTEDPEASVKTTQWIADPNVHTIWFLRNTHDVSPTGLDAQFERQLGSGMRVTRFFYEPFTPLEERAMQAVGMKDPPQYFHELVEFQR
jgi:hypothetical protein